MDMRSFARAVSRTLLAIAAGTLLSSCDLAHTNPVDPDSRVTMTILGPTEIHSHSQPIDYTFTSVPAWHFAAPQWESSAPSVLAVVTTGGRFVSGQDSVAVITLHLGPHSTELRVTVSQVASGVTVRTCDGRPAQIAAIGGTLPLCAFVHDSVGSPVAGQGLSLASDDASVVELEDTIAIARRAGATHIHASAGEWRDSLLVTVGP
jgi:hypothetical protein